MIFRKIYLKEESQDGEPKKKVILGNFWMLLGKGYENNSMLKATKKKLLRETRQ